MRLGYARVSTGEQNLTVQTAALREAGCRRVFTDKLSGLSYDRPGLAALLDHIRKGDEVLVWKLDRLGRKPGMILRLIEDIEHKGATFRSVTQPEFSTAGPHGRFMLQIFAGIAELEREMIVERCEAGRHRAKKRGVVFGRPPVLDGKEKAKIVSDIDAGLMTVGEASSLFGVSRSTVYRLIGTRK